MPFRFTDLLNGKDNAVFLGESGSGKTEIAINFALGLKAETDRTVHFFDMDQTKPLFRSRDVADRLQKAGVVFHSNTQESIEDVPSTPPGVAEALRERDSYVILDVGGNERGARMLGQYHAYLNADTCQAFFVINPYCAWSKDFASIAVTVDKILRSARIARIQVISNPNFGAETTAEDVAAGHGRLKDMLQGRLGISCVCAMERLCPELRGKMDEALVPIHRFMLYPWQVE